MLSLIIPAYNESSRILPTLAAVLDYLRAQYPDFELIVVDDGSRDDTAAVVTCALANEPRARLITYQPNRGKGYALRQGVLASRGAQVVFTDADLSTPIEELPRQEKVFPEHLAKLVVCSRTEGWSSEAVVIHESGK